MKLGRCDYLITDRTVGLGIKQYMVNNGISQVFVSSKTKMSAPILNAILNSKRNCLAEEYFAICEALSVPLSTFNETNKQENFQSEAIR